MVYRTVKLVRGTSVLRLVLVAGLAAGLLLQVGLAQTGNALAVDAQPAAVTVTPPFEPITDQRIAVPQVKEVAQPAYSRDGEHILFSGDYQLWIVGTDGSDARCLTCHITTPWNNSQPGDIAATPFYEGAPDQPALIQPFPDGKRVFFGPYVHSYVLECTPSVIDCQTKSILPIDYSGAEQKLALPGGAAVGLHLLVPGPQSPKLSPDGKYVGFSQIRTDTIEAMTLAKLNKGTKSYTLSDTRFLNPPAPTSIFDTDVDAWSRSSGLFEFKTFADGGRSVTYVQVGGEAGSNPDVWKVNLATGVRTRLTAYPDWDEDHAISPDGNSMVVQFARGQHGVDSIGGLMPYRSFFDAALVGAAAKYFVGSAERRNCLVGADWLLPGTGDDGARLLGQPTTVDDGGPVRATGILNGYPQWSPDSTAIVEGTIKFSDDKPANYVNIRHFPARTPTTPIPVGSSAPGAWAATPNSYHGVTAAVAIINLKGKASGTVTVRYYNPFGVAGGAVNSATYVNYSDDGQRFINGTDAINLTGGVTKLRVNTDLTMTGTKSGSLKRDLKFSPDANGELHVAGSTTVTYDGKTLTGPTKVDEPCPNFRDALPKAQPLEVAAVRGTDGGVRVSVAAAFAQAGANELGTDRRPVVGATVTAGVLAAVTNAQGDAVLTLPSGWSGTVHVTAGDTFAATDVTVG
ncbi:MAG: hypothetical protein JWQ74_1091 [Marmoricola sp.]|nr:hypothetical protein [Marmoricola sp.]